MLERHDRPRPSHASRSSLGLRLVAAAVTLVAAAACGSEPTAGELAAANMRANATGGTDARAAAAAQENRDLATLRAATARFHRNEAALDADYTFVFLNACMVDESGERRGGMGFHYVNPLLLDGTVDVASPEALLYEPGPNGQLRLVGVEYVIPRDMWTGAEPPRLFGRDFTLNAFDLWALHVWAWKDNPSGLYADWNPRVTCDHAPAVAAGSHH